MNIGEIIKRIRISEGLTRKELSFISGYHESVIKRYESGVNEPKFEKVSDLLNALGYELKIERKI